MERIRKQRAGTLQETPELAGLAERGQFPQYDFRSKVVAAVGTPVKLQKLLGGKSYGDVDGRIREVEFRSDPMKKVLRIEDTAFAGPTIFNRAGQWNEERERCHLNV